MNGVTRRMGKVSRSGTSASPMAQTLVHTGWKYRVRRGSVPGTGMASAVGGGGKAHALADQAAKKQFQFHEQRRGMHRQGALRAGRQPHLNGVAPGAVPSPGLICRALRVLKG
ncbi:hypothetical protein GGI1_13244 [Acidithiobacillus sp. GGI-221]|nr:hypothetical protein GGI1_13244 [Acidithiobacillus sp. GGI-221]